MYITRFRGWNNFLNQLSIKALNATIVEITLDDEIDAPTSVVLDHFIVTDEDDAIIEIEEVEFAPWDADKYTVLVTVEALEAGNLYTVTSGDDSANFGGRTDDEDAPEVTSIESSDYNEVTVTFNESVLIDDLTIELTEKYGDKDELPVLDFAYDGSDTIVVTTDGQDDSVLYASVINGATDLAGNEMDEDDSMTFVGQQMPTDDLTVDGAQANDYNEVSVLFNLDVDPASVSAEMFTIFEKYGDEAEIAVLDAVVAADDDESYGSVAIADASVTDSDQYVILTVEALEDSTLYEIEVTDVMSAYDTDLDSDESTTTFVGMSMPEDDVTLDSADAISNTEVDLTFANDIDADSVTADMFTITEKYEDNDELAVLDVSVDGSVVTLTVESMENILYEVEVETSIMDIYGNDLDADYTTESFVGEEIADEIENDPTIKRLSDTTIAVIFDENLGENAEDVSFYTIDGGVGYPEAADLADEDDQDDYSQISDYNKTVILTIPETTDGKIYTLTVNEGLENADGIATTEELSKTFTGAGDAAGLPELEAVMAYDNQTLMIYFDRDVTDSTIEGKIWDGDDKLIVDALSIDTDGDETADYDLFAKNEYVYQDYNDDNVLVIRLDATEFEKSDSTASNNTFNLIANDKLVESDDDADILEFGYNDSDMAAPELESAIMLNNETLRLYFTEPVNLTDAREVLFLADSEDTGSQIAEGKTATSFNTDDDIVFDIVLDTKITSDDLTDDIGYVYFADNVVMDITNTVSANDADDEEVFIELSVGANYDDADEDMITDVFAWMLDNRTIQVQYPEAMNAAQATTTANYRLVTDEDGSTGADTGTVNFIADADGNEDTGYAEYDDNIVTLYLDADIDDLDLNKYYLAIDNSVENELGTNNIDPSETGIATLGSGIVFEFAIETDEPATPELISASVSDDRYELTIEFDQKMDFGAVLAGVTAFDDTEDELDTAADILTYLDITAQFEGEDEDTVTSGDIFSTAISSDDTEVIITFNTKLKASTSGTVTTEGETAVNSKVGTPTEVNSDASEVTFGVAASLYTNADETAAETAVAALEAAVLLDISNDTNNTTADNAKTAADAAVAAVVSAPAKAAFQARVTEATLAITAADTIEALVVTAEADSATAVGTVNASNVSDAKTAIDAPAAHGTYSDLSPATKAALDARVATAKSNVVAVLTLDVTGTNTPGATATVAKTTNYMAVDANNLTGFTQDLSASAATFVAGTGTYTYVGDQVATVVTFTDAYWGVTDTVTITTATPNVTVSND